MWITSGAQNEPVKPGILALIQAGQVLNTGPGPPLQLTRSFEVEYQIPCPVVKLK